MPRNRLQPGAQGLHREYGQWSQAYSSESVGWVGQAFNIAPDGFIRPGDIIRIVIEPLPDSCLTSPHLGPVWLHYFYWDDFTPERNHVISDHFYDDILTVTVDVEIEVLPVN